MAEKTGKGERSTFKDSALFKIKNSSSGYKITLGNVSDKNSRLRNIEITSYL